MGQCHASPGILPAGKEIDGLARRRRKTIVCATFGLVCHHEEGKKHVRSGQPAEPLAPVWTNLVFSLSPKKKK
jgi:hypothetical protein